MNPYSSSSALYDSVGINTHLNYTDLNYGNLPLVVDQLRQLGIKHLRDGLHGWPNADAFSVYNEIYSTVALQLDARFDCVVDPSENLGTITSSLLYSFYAGYGSTIESFEGWNEPDIGEPVGWPQKTRDWQKNLFEQASHLPEAIVKIPTWGPSLAYATQHARDLGNISGICDAANLHPYPAGEAPEPVIQDQLQYGKIMAGTKPVVVTETGYFTGTQGNPHAAGQPSVSEAAAAKYTLRLLLDHFAQGIPRTWLYELQDEGPDNNWGLVRWDGTAKLSFKGISNLMSILYADYAPLTALNADLVNTASVRTLLLQRSCASWILFLWQAVSVYDTRKSKDIANPRVPVQISFGSSRSVKVFEPLTQRNAIGIGTSVTHLTVEVSDHPIAVVIC